MSKIKISVSIINNELSNIIKTTAIKNDNILKYKEEDNTTVLFDYKKKELKRENNEIKMLLVFKKNKKTKGSIFIKELNKIVDINIYTKEINKNNNNIEIEYTIDENKHLYRIEEIIWAY